MTINKYLRPYALFFALLVIWVIFQITTEGAFLSARNMSNLTRQSCITALLAVGMVLVIVSGNIDLSVGSLVGFTGGMAAIMDAWWEWPLLFAILLTLLLGMLIGLLQGWLVAYRSIPAFIVTLAGLMVFRGAVKGATGGETVGPLSSNFKFIGQAYLNTNLGWALAVLTILIALWLFYRRHRSQEKYGFEVTPLWTVGAMAIFMALVVITFVTVLNSYEGIPIPVLVLLSLALVFHFLATKTTFGRRVYAIGGNVEAAHLSGINIKRNTMMVFMLMGILSSVAGMIYTARVGSATADAGKILELDAIAACVIGGSSLMGGSGTIGGALIGALVMASLDNGMSLMNVEYFYQDIIKGLILVIAVWVDIAGKKGGWMSRKS